MRRCHLIVLLLTVAAIAAAGLFLHDQYEQEARLVAEQNRTALDVAYRASIETYRLDVATRFRLQVMRPEVLAILEQAQAAPEESLALLRGRLYRLLYTEYQSMKEAGLRQFQFHLPDDRALLRFHRPERVGDPLFAIRPSLRVANSERRPVTGLESGRTYPGFRYVFPIEHAGRHLGSVELSLPFERIHDNLRQLLPQGDYAIVFARAAVLDGLDPGKRENFVDAPLHPDYLMEHPTLSRVSRNVVAAAVTQTLDPLLRADPQVQRRMTAAESFGVPVLHRGQGYIATFLPVADILGRHTAYVVGYAEAPVVAAIHAAMQRHSAVAALLILLLAAAVVGLLRHRRQLAQSHARLQASEDRFRSIFERANAGIVFGDAEGALMEANAAFVRLVGYDADELNGMNFARLTHPDDLPAELDLIDGVRTGARDGYRLEKRYITKTGDVAWVDLAITALRDDTGRARNFVGMAIDISGRKRSQQALADSEAFLRTVTDIIPSMLSYWDRDLRCRFANAFIRHWFGRSADEMDGLPIRELLGETLFRRNEPHIRAALRGEPQQFGRSLTGRDGKPRHTWTHYIPDLVEGEVRGVFVLVSDVSELKAAQLGLEELNRQLTQRTAEAEAANRAKSEFLANMSHEIRTPMNAVLGLIQLVLETELAPQQADFLGKAHTSAKALLGILNEILDYSKIEAGQMVIEREPFAVEGVLRQVADLFEAQVAEKGLELFLDITPEVPRKVIGDRLRLLQVLNNLVGNALKFTERGAIHVKAEVASLDDDGSTLRFAVRDTGIGLSRSQAERLFRAFAQADGSITRKYGGTGLGLAISRRLVALMDGEITATGAEGTGATFTFTVRVGAVADAGVAAQRTPLHGRRVLVVDDQQIARHVARRFLEQYGATVQCAESGEQALAAIHKAQTDGRPFDTVLLDWQMPGLSGLDVARRLEQEVAGGDPAHPLTVVMATAFDREELLARADGVHLDGVLHKPVTPSGLLHLLVRGPGPEPGPVATAPNRAAGGPTRELQGVRVLLVEDNHINREMATEFLRRRGLVVTTASDGAEAVERVRQAAFDGVLMDLHMPGMDGLEASRRIAALDNGRDLPVIAMSAAVMQEDRERCRAAGMVDFVAKPIDPDEFLRVLRRWLAPSGDAGTKAARRDGEAVGEGAAG